MRTSSPPSTNYSPASDVKFVARTPALGCGPLSALCAQPVWGEQANRGVRVAWHASQHASPAVEGALHFELQACTFFPAST